MPRIQGKQLAKNTITQDLLNLTLPNSGDTLSGATVEYVNSYVTQTSGTTVIGPAEDGVYTDGLFTDFVDDTRVGVAVDRINEVLLKLAPTPPSESWDNTFSNLRITSAEYSARALTSGTAVNNITSDTTPSYEIDDTVGIETNAKALPTDANTLDFLMSDTSGILESHSITSSSTNKTTGIIQYSISDPYNGIAGKEGFWTGITSFSVNGTISSAITPSANQKTLTFTHPGSDSPETYNYYVDNPQTPTVGTISITTPTMSSYISGVPTLSSGQSISGIDFDITNAVSYFYNNSMYDITGTLINNVTDKPPSTIPTTSGATVSETGLSVTVANNQFSDTLFGFDVTARSADGTGGINTYSSSTLRVDTVSDESSRLTSGSGNYPSSGYGGVYVSTSSLSTTYTDEMMLRNGTYQYPSGDYTTYGGDDYSTITGTRWATFNLGTFTNNRAFTLNFIGSAGITLIGQSNLYVEVKIEGATSWVDGDAAYVVSTNPGSSTDGDAAVVFGSSTPTSRRITFGSIPYSGNIIVRVGFISSGPSFTSLTATDIV